MGKMGRPKKNIDETQLRGLLRLKPTLEDTAAFFGCSVDTIEKACKRYGNVTFTEFRRQNMVHTRLNLVREAIQQATTKNNTAMLIFCLKNVCHWKDRVEETVIEDRRYLKDRPDEELDQSWDNDELDDDESWEDDRQT